ncbi:MAG: hypothetical protein DLM55_09230 [Acidimicrobiales bacterium]|nr:MAG: hypothetical protein DLM55_09230 [Acidimicrobiales bacterium]
MPHSGRPSIYEIPLGAPDSGPYDITTGPDGALWLTMVHTGQLSRMTLDGHLDHYPLDPTSCGPSIIIPGSDATLWFTRIHDHRIGRISTAGDTMSFRVPTPSSGPFGIVTGPDDALWFTQMPNHTASHSALTATSTLHWRSGQSHA